MKSVCFLQAEMECPWDIPGGQRTVLERALEPVLGSSVKAGQRWRAEVVTQVVLGEPFREQQPLTLALTR